MDVDVPGNRTLESAPLSVQPAPRAQEITVRLSRGLVLAGKVKLATPRPGRGLLVFRATSDEIVEQVFECCPEADGSFSLPVPWTRFSATAPGVVELTLP